MLSLKSKMSKKNKNKNKQININIMQFFLWGEGGGTFFFNIKNIKGVVLFWAKMLNQIKINNTV